MRKLLLGALAAGLVGLGTTAHASPFTTVERTMLDCDSDNLLDMAFGERHVIFPGTPDQREEDPCEDQTSGEDLRLPPTASIINFLQLSDFQMVDEESPGRVEWLDGTQRVERAQPFSAAYRPQESLTTHVTEAMVRQARNSVSPVTAAPLDLTILTGDNADSQQHNETRWFIDILDGTAGPGNPDPEMEDVPDPENPTQNLSAPTAGRKVDPNSGIPTPDCEATPGTVYDGVRDSGKRRVAPDFGYWDPDTSADPNADGDGYTPNRFDNAAETAPSFGDVTVRDWPGLLESANEPFEAIGLDMPWYSAFGNHDALVQGNDPGAYIGPEGTSGEQFEPGHHEFVTGCQKVMQPSLAGDVQGFVDQLVPLLQRIPPEDDPGTPEDEAQRFRDRVNELTQAIQDAVPDAALQEVPRDPRRCYLAKDDNGPLTTGPGLAPGPCSTGSWIRQHFRTTGTPVGHGFAPTLISDCAKYGPEREACEGARADVQGDLGRPPQAVAHHDGYYSFVPKPGLRFVVLDTVTDECGTIFCSEGSVDDEQFRWLRQQIESAASPANAQYVVVFSHHTLRTTRFPSTDPSELPMHYGQRFDRRSPANPQNQTGGETLEELFCQHPNVLAHVAGHEHENYVLRYDCADDTPAVPGANPHFWHISTAAHIDWPQQARLIELVNLDGAMSFVLTMLDHDGPANPGGAPPPREEQDHTPDDVTRLAGIGREVAYNDYQADRGATGDRQDRNVILPTERPPPPYIPLPLP
jgi:3',5'-cyclic AMP phosphodiesterase CpdA